MATISHLFTDNTMLAVVQSALRLHNDIAEMRVQSALLAKTSNEIISPYFARRGWFVGGSLCPHDYVWLTQQIKEKNDDTIEMFLIERAKLRVTEVHAQCRKHWISRAVILDDAFEAHSAHKYSLSVPVFLAQSDGIALDVFSSFLFTQHSGKVSDKIRAAIEDNFCERPLAASFLKPIAEHLTIRQGTAERDAQRSSGQVVSPLNRHGVLHGIDLDYATESNSLRAICLIEILAWYMDVSLKADAA